MLSHRTSSRHGDLSSDGAMSVFAEALTTSIAAGADVFNSAPFWWWSSDWWCKHPDASKDEQSHIVISGPHSSDEMHQLYRNRQLKGSNLVVGLSASMPAPRHGDSIPSAFFRTLAYLFEMAKAGTTYAPVTPADLARGMPDVSWCQPLWGSYPTPEQSASQPCEPSDTESATQPPSISSLSLSDASAAEKLLMSSPYWCYLYSHEPAKEPAKETAKAKKTPPKNAELMLQYYRDRCLPDWTPILGLERGVATYNALPPCLFMTLGSLIRLTASGAMYKALTDGELQAWDKFSDSRNPATGSTMGVGAAGSGQPPVQLRGRQSPAAPRHSTGSQQYSSALYMPPQQQHQSAPSAFVQYQQSQTAVYPASQYPPAPVSPSMMWYGSGGFGAPFATNQLYRPLGPAMMPQVPPHAGQDKERSSDMGPLRNMERVFRTQLSCPTPPALTTGLARQESRGLDRPSGSAPPGLHRLTGGRWSTAIFRLFTADATREHAEAAWWYMVPGDPQAFGPCTDEQMIILYLQGHLNDDHFVCGIMADVGACPPLSQFERIGTIMKGVETGGEYHLLTAADYVAMMGPGHDRYERHSYSGPHAEAARRRGRNPMPMPAHRGAAGFSMSGRQFGGSSDPSVGR